MTAMQHITRLIPILLVMSLLVACVSPAPPVADQGSPTASAASTTPISAESATPRPDATTAAQTTQTTTSSASSPAPATTTLPTADSTSTAVTLPEIALIEPGGAVVLVRGPDRYQMEKRDTSAGQWDCDSGIAWSPDGYRLALDDGIYTFGDDPRSQPRHAPISGSDFRWSSDGAQLAWLAGVDEHLDVIRVGGPDGDAARAVAGAHWGYTGLIAWSPDGRTVAAGPLQAATDGSGQEIVEGRGRNPVWSPDGTAVAWTTSDTDGTTGTITITSEMQGSTTTLGTITVPMPGAAAPPQELERVRLRWLPDNSLLLALPPAVLLEGAGTYRINNGTAERVSPHALCDLAPDGERMVALTKDKTLMIVRLADGVVESELGVGVAAAWRPQPQGAPPSAPLAEKSPQLALTTPRISSDAVKELQQRLTEQGHSVGEIDGIFGPGTEAAVRQFQEQTGLTVDGVVGPRTWAALRFDAKRTTEQF